MYFIMFYIYLYWIYYIFKGITDETYQKGDAISRDLRMTVIFFGKRKSAPCEISRSTIKTYNTLKLVTLNRKSFLFHLILWEASPQIFQRIEFRSKRSEERKERKTFELTQISDNYHNNSSIA